MAIFDNATFLLVYVILNDALFKFDPEKSVVLQLQSEKHIPWKDPLINFVPDRIHPLIIVLLLVLVEYNPLSPPVFKKVIVLKSMLDKSGLGLIVLSKYDNTMFDPNKYEPLR